MHQDAAAGAAMAAVRARGEEAGPIGRLEALLWKAAPEVPETTTATVREAVAREVAVRAAVVRAAAARAALTREAAAREALAREALAREAAARSGMRRVPSAASCRASPALGAAAMAMAAAAAMARAAAGSAADAGRPATAASADGAALATHRASVAGERATAVAAAWVGPEATAVAGEDGREDPSVVRAAAAAVRAVGRRSAPSTCSGRRLGRIHTWRRSCPWRRGLARTRPADRGAPSTSSRRRTLRRRGSPAAPRHRREG